MECLIMVALVVYVIYDEWGKRQMNYWFDMEDMEYNVSREREFCNLSDVCPLFNIIILILYHIIFMNF